MASSVFGTRKHIDEMSLCAQQRVRLVHAGAEASKEVAYRGGVG
jgi:hypothetical protein